MERRNGAVFQQGNNNNASVLPLQTITIRNQSDNTLASIFSDDGVTPKANPFTSGADGEYFYYAANGRYKEEIGDPVFETREDILLHDPGETRLPTTSTDEALGRFDGVKGNMQNSANGPFGTDAGMLVTHPTSGPYGVIGGRIGVLSAPPNDNANDINGNGLWLTTSSTTNGPGAFTAILRHEANSSGDRALQTAIQLGPTTNEIWVRHKFNGAWRSWTLIGTNSGFQMTGALDFRSEQSLASAATTDLGSVAGNIIQVTGTTTITSFGTAPAGTWRVVRFAAALTLTHSGIPPLLILPGAANITTAANDCLIAYSLGSGNWIVTHYQRASGFPVSGGLGTADYDSGEQTVTTSNVLSLNHGIAAKPRLIVVNLRCKTAELGYSVDEEIELNEIGHNTASRNYTVSKDSTQIHINTASELITLSKSTNAAAAITPGNWRWVIQAWA